MNKTNTKYKAKRLRVQTFLSKSWKSDNLKESNRGKSISVNQKYQQIEIFVFQYN